MTTGAESFIWRTSSRCDSGTCVEVAVTDDHVLLRNSSDPDGPRLSFTRAEWAEFLGRVRRDFAD
jgi:hypothetical protein